MVIITEQKSKLIPFFHSEVCCYQGRLHLKCLLLLEEKLFLKSKNDLRRFVKKTKSRHEPVATLCRSSRGPVSLCVTSRLWQLLICGSNYLNTQTKQASDRDTHRIDLEVFVLGTPHWARYYHTATHSDPPVCAQKTHSDSYRHPWENGHRLQPSRWISFLKHLLWFLI